ncbi:hypothetical protein ABBQ32_005268 [Trebouxia sp. C0010 RCD-2024]
MLHNGGVRLDNVLQAVPAVLQSLPSSILKALLHTSSAVRCAAQHHASVLRIPARDLGGDDPDIQLSVKGAWTELQRLELNCTNLTTKSASHLRSGNWPHLRHLNIGNNSLNAEAIKQLVLGKWPKLEELVLSNTIECVKPTVQHLASSTWPMLKSLHLSNMELDSAAMSELTNANWPLLTTWISVAITWSMKPSLFWSVATAHKLGPRQQLAEHSLYRTYRHGRMAPSGRTVPP